MSVCAEHVCTRALPPPGDLSPQHAAGRAEQSGAQGRTPGSHPFPTDSDVYLLQQACPGAHALERPAERWQNGDLERAQPSGLTSACYGD